MIRHETVCKKIISMDRTRLLHDLQHLFVDIVIDEQPRLGPGADYDVIDDARRSVVEVFQPHRPGVTPRLVETISLHPHTSSRVSAVFRSVVTPVTTNVICISLPQEWQRYGGLWVTPYLT